MNAAQIHLALNHFPIAGVGLGFLLLLVAAVSRKEEWAKAGWLVCLLAALAALPVFFSGEPAEELVHSLPGVSDEVMHQHEALARWALASMVLLGLLALGGWVVLPRTPRWSRPWLLASLAWALASSLLLARTAHLGGQIHHPELRGETTGQPLEEHHEEEHE